MPDRERAGANRARGRGRGIRKPRGEGEVYASSKRVEREARQAQSRRHGRTRLAVLGAVLLLLIVSMVLVSRSGAFAVRTIEVRGAKHLAAAHVRELAKVPESATLLRVGTTTIRERVASDPWVSNVEVKRDFPHALVITVTERTPAALLDLGNTFWVLDTQGWVLQKASLEATSSLPVVRDVENTKPKVGARTQSMPLRNALEVLSGLSAELRQTVRAVSAPSIDETALITVDGVEMRFGSAADVAKKDALARRILKDQAGKVVFIDVRTVDRPVWRGLGE